LSRLNIPSTTTRRPDEYYGGDAGGCADDGANIYADYAQKQQEKADKGGGCGG